MKCPNCGKESLPDERFCRECGAKLTENEPKAADGRETGAEKADSRPEAEKSVFSRLREGLGRSENEGSPLYGWSSIAKSKAYRAPSRRKRIAVTVITLIIAAAFPLGFAIIAPSAGLEPRTMAYVGLAFSALTLAVGVWRFAKIKGGHRDGRVAGKTVFQNEDGTESCALTIRSFPSRERRVAVPREVYGYFSEDDRIRFHRTFGTYEKFDKCSDSAAPCIFCGTMNPASADVCAKCGKPTVFGAAKEVSAPEK